MIDNNEWLVVIDRQQVFAHSEWSRWACTEGSFYRTDRAFSQLAQAYGNHVVYTRYVAPASPSNAWVAYFKDWPEFLVPPDDPMYNLTDDTAQLAQGHQVVSKTTFGKWGRELTEAIENSHSVTLCGVATDCCVLQTALAAADDGVTVTIAADACAGSTPENHELALRTMGLFSPLITVSDSATILS